MFNFILHLVDYWNSFVRLVDLFHFEIVKIKMSYDPFNQSQSQKSNDNCPTIFQAPGRYIQKGMFYV